MRPSLQATSDQSRSRFYVRELDGVRCLAFIAVFLHHSVGAAAASRPDASSWYHLQWWTSGAVLAGGFSVDLFFVISSYLITSLLLREEHSTGRIDVPAFWMRRMLRIWPLYLSFVVLCWIVERLPAVVVGAFAGFAGNWAILAGIVPERSVIHPLWTVSIEEQFYIAWPLVLAFLPRRLVAPLCVAEIALSVGCRSLILAGGGEIARVWYSTPARLDPIAIGSLIALTAGQRRIVIGAAVRRAVASGALLVIVAMTCVIWHELMRPGPSGGPMVAREGAWPVAAAALAFTVVAIACGALIVAVLAARGSWLGHPVLVYLGRISYGLYVFHLAAIRLVEPVPAPLGLIVGFAVTVGLAAVSYRVLEEPFLRLKERFTYIRSGLPPASDPLAAAVTPAASVDAVSK